MLLERFGDRRKALAFAFDQMPLRLDRKARDVENRQFPRGLPADQPVSGEHRNAQLAPCSLPDRLVAAEFQ